MVDRVKLTLAWRLLFKAEADRVDAVAKACGRWAIGEHMTKMRITTAASHLDPDHSMASILDFDEVCTIEWFKEAGPAASGIKLRVRLKKGKLAADTTEHPNALFIQQGARPRWLRAPLAGHMK